MFILKLKKEHNVDRDEILLKVKKTIVEVLKIRDFFITEGKIIESAKINNLEIDSMYIIEVVMYIEDEFDIVLEDEEVDKIETVGDIVDLICSKLPVARGQ
ncbi:MAG: phosphopantetheine-binding protein [bacterium]